MSKEPENTITLTPRQVAVVHEFIFGPAHLSCNQFSLIDGYIELRIRHEEPEKRLSLLKRLSGCAATAEDLFKRLADEAERAQLAVQDGRFCPQNDGELSGESFNGLRRPTTPVSLKAKQLEAYFRRFADWAKKVTALVNATLNRIEQSTSDSSLIEVHDEFKSGSAVLWEAQKLLVAKFNSMCGIERRERNQQFQMG